MQNDTNDLRRQWEEKLSSPEISDRDRQKIQKLLEALQEGQNPEALQSMIQRQSRKLIIAIVVSILGLGLLIGGLIVGITWYTSSIVEQTVPVPGDPTRFDPIASLSEIQSFAGEGSKLLSINALYVKSDGTMDLTASYHPSVEYQFFRETSPPKDAPPVGAGSSPNGAWFEPVTIKAYEPGQWHHVKIMGGVSTEYSYRNNGMERDTSKPVSSPPGTPLSDPACAFSDLWRTALDRGASASAVAIIEYNDDGYIFTINDTDITLMFDSECKLKNKY
ncbi:MAG: hypothetical protein ABIB04_00925 [Patescibacteria group bacterium]